MRVMPFVHGERDASRPLVAESARRNGASDDHEGGEGMKDDAGASYSESGYPAFRWLERGEGEPVVLLHGLMGRIDHWEQTLEALTGLCRSIALSLPILEEDMPESSIEEVG